MANVYAPPSQGHTRKALVLSLIGLVLFLGLEAILMRRFVRTDTRPPAWDQAIHLEIALDYKEALKEGRISDAWHLAPKSGMPPFPPAYHLLLTRAYASADPARAALWLNWFYLALLGAAVFGISWHFRPDATALAAAIIFCSAPGIQELYTTQLVDLPLTALVAAAYWALLLSDGFRRWLPGLLFGLVHAAGMMHKWSYFTYMIPAYVVFLRSLGDPLARMKSPLWFLLSFGLTAPWYFAHAALLPSRLVQASADFAIPFWAPGAWSTYLKSSVGPLGPVLWLLGLIGLIAPQHKRNNEDGWVLQSWAAAAYLVWTIVPNRQIRFLMPGLVPLGIALCGTWPRAVSWTAAGVQLLGLLNFFSGWVGPLSIPLPFKAASATFFENRPPAAHDWKIEEILRKVEELRDTARPVTNVTVVANDEYFNATTFHWSRRRLGLEHARMRGVNKRLCEFSEFVLLKDGRLGPPSVIDGLENAAKQIKDPKGWFSTAYGEVGRWPLPDGSTALLFRQKRGTPKPYPGKSLAYQYFVAGKAEIQEMKLGFGDWDPVASVYKNLRVSAARADVHGLRVTGLDFELDEAGFVPVYQDARTKELNDVRFMRLKRLRVESLEIEGDNLRAFLENRIKGMRVATLKLDKTVAATGTWQGKPFEIEVALEFLDSPRRLQIRPLRASLAGIGLPLSVFKEIKELTIPLAPNPETPFAIELAGLTLKDNRISVP